MISTVSGYTGGTVPNPGYERVSAAGGTGHTEAVEVTYDPSKVSYAQLLEFYWHSIDPTVKDAQFLRSRQSISRTEIFVRNAE